MYLPSEMRAYEGEISVKLPTRSVLLIEDLIDNGYQNFANPPELQASPTHMITEDLNPSNIMSNIYYKSNDNCDS